MSSAVICGFGRPTAGYQSILKRWRHIQKYCNFVSNNNKIGTPQIGTQNSGTTINNDFFKVSDFMNALETDPNWKKMQKMYENEIKKNGQNLKCKNNIYGDLKKRKYTTLSQKWNFHRMLHTHGFAENPRSHYQLIYSNLTQSSNWTNASNQIWHILNEINNYKNQQYDIKNDYQRNQPSLIQYELNKTTQSIQLITKSIRRNFRNNINRRILLRKLHRFEILIKLFMHRIDYILEHFDEPRKARLIRLFDMFANKLLKLKLKIWHIYCLCNTTIKCITNIIFKMNEWRKRHLITDKVYNNKMIGFIKSYRISNHFYEQQMQYFNQISERILHRTKHITGVITRAKYILAVPKSRIIKGHETITEKLKSPERIRLDVENVIKNLNIVAPPIRQKSKWKSVTVQTAASCLKQNSYFLKAKPFKLNCMKEMPKKRKVGVMSTINGGKLATSNSVNVASFSKESLNTPQCELKTNKSTQSMKTANIDLNNYYYRPLKEFKVQQSNSPTMKLNNEEFNDLTSANTDSLTTNDFIVPKEPEVLNTVESVSIKESNLLKTNIDSRKNSKRDSSAPLKSLQNNILNFETINLPKKPTARNNDPLTKETIVDNKETNSLNSVENDSFYKDSFIVLKSANYDNPNSVKEFNSKNDLPRTENDFKSNILSSKSVQDLKNDSIKNVISRELNVLKSSEIQSESKAKDTFGSLKVFNLNASKNHLLDEEPIGILKTIYMGNDFKDLKIDSKLSHTNTDIELSNQSDRIALKINTKNDDRLDKIRDIRSSVLNRINSFTESIKNTLKSDSNKDTIQTDTGIDRITFSTLRVFNKTTDNNKSDDEYQRTNSLNSSNLLEKSSNLRNNELNNSCSTVVNINSHLIKYCTCKDNGKLKNKYGKAINSLNKARTKIISKMEEEHLPNKISSNKLDSKPEELSKHLNNTNEFTEAMMMSTTNSYDQPKKSISMLAETNTLSASSNQKESIMNSIKSVEPPVVVGINSNRKTKDSKVFDSTKPSNIKKESRTTAFMNTSKESNRKESVADKTKSQKVSKMAVLEEKSCGTNAMDGNEWDIEIRRIQLNDLNRINPMELDNYVCTVIMPQEIKSIEQLTNIIQPLTNIKQINEYQYSAVIGKDTKIKTNKSDIHLSTVCNNDQNPQHSHPHSKNSTNCIEDVKVKIKINDDNILKSATMALNINNKNMTLLSRQCNIEESEATQKHLEKVKNAGKELEIQYLCERCQDSINYLNTLSRISVDALTILERDKLNKILASISNKCNIIITKFDTEKAECTVKPPRIHDDNINIYREPETMSLKSSTMMRDASTSKCCVQNDEGDVNILNTTEYKNVDLIIFEDTKTSTTNDQDNLNPTILGLQDSNGRNLVEYKNVNLIVTKYNAKGSKTNQHIMTIDVHKKTLDKKSQTNDDSNDKPIFKFKESVTNKYPPKNHQKSSKYGAGPGTQTHTLLNVFEKSMINDDYKDYETQINMKPIQTDKAFLPPIGVKEATPRKQWKPKKCSNDSSPSLFGFFDDIIKGVANKLKQNQDSNSSSKLDKFSQTNRDYISNNLKKCCIETINKANKEDSPILIDLNSRIIIENNEIDLKENFLEPSHQISNEKLIEINKIDHNNNILIN